jgi:hypothetical protein
MKNLFKQISLLYKIVGLFLIVSVSIIAYAKINSANEAFSQAKDFPEDALCYVQFQDLPALYNIWDESELKQKYLESANYNEFENNHLAMKLISRLEEFNAASKFPLDISTLLSSSETRAAIAVYDIGRLEFVFVAPLSEEKILASQFFLNKSAFEENKLEDGTLFYSSNVEADRGRQKQKLLFTTLRGRFVLGTDEVKFFKTLDLIGGKSKGKSVFDETGFRNLREKITPHLATIWVNQRKLNDDWYFKLYWAFKNLENLKKINAGIFDFEMQENKLIEHRKFLLNNKSTGNEATISDSEVQSLQKFIPEDVPFVKFQAARKTSENVSEDIYQTLLDGFSGSENDDGYKDWNSYNRFHFTDYGENDWDSGYRYLGSRYESEINETDEDFATGENDSTENEQLFGELRKIIQAANPKVSASLIKPENLPMPLFFECRRGFVLSLQNSKNLDRNALENVISKLAQNQLTVAKNNAILEWKNSENWRELKMPMLGWKLVYAVKNNEIIFANSEVLLKSMLENKSVENVELEQKKDSFDEFTKIRLSQHDAAFDSVMREIRKQEANADTENFDFFVDNVGSLFEVLSNVNRVEIKKSSSENYLSEELEFILE